MGIRFACHVCKKQLNIKRNLAGRRGICPQCQSRFRIPAEDSEHSTPVDAARFVEPEMSGPSKQGGTVEQGGTAIMAGSKVVSQQATISVPSDSEPELQDEPRMQDEPKMVVRGQAVQEEAELHTVGGSILEEESNASWYVRPPSGGQYGPASTDELREWISQGRVAASALLWRDGWPQWRDAGEALPELSNKLPDAIGSSGNVTMLPEKPTLQVEAGTRQAKGKKSGIVLSGATGIGAERRLRTTRRIGLIAILVAIAALLIAVLVYAITR